MGETCANIFKVADVSTKFHLRLLVYLSRTLFTRNLKYSAAKCYVIVEMFFDYARHGLLKLFFKTLIRLKQKVLAEEELSDSVVLFHNTLTFFFNHISYTR